ncbi:oligosaccharide flippase family protein [Bradyrhizobium ottawaense]|uniref:oligosaccharide flippase family protein n=1 Tax=Bradyrhizobium ottawaense TaxID=931866 RepID=UPI001BA6BBAF|nr:oligosaccharide flippase family protein [Bradyrhizobium ottawaense]MBR1363431.1 oligosaccharide flippase family protein [Bradyrhizobium ottawaense]
MSLSFLLKASLFRSSLIYLLATGLSAGAPLVLLPILTRALSPEEYGHIAMFSVAAQIFGITTGLSTHGAVGMKYFDRDAIDFPRFVGSCLIILLISTVVTLLFAWTTLDWLKLYLTLPGSWLLIAVAFSACNFIVQVQLSIWQSSKEAFRFASLRSFQGATDLAASFILALSLALGWQGRVSGMAISSFVAACLALYLMRRSGWIRLPHDAVYMRDALRFGLPLVPHAAGAMLIMISDRFLVANVLGVASTGIYLVAAQLGMILYLANDALNRAYSPHLIENLKLHDQARDRQIVRFTYAYFIGILAVAIAFGLLAPIILGALAGPKFQAASSIFIFIAIGQAFSGMYLVVATYIFYTGRTSYLAMVTIPAGIANITITYYLLKHRGLIGAAQAFMITQLLFFIGTWALAQRSRPMPWLKALGLDVAVFVRPGLIGLAMTTYAIAFIPSGKWHYFSEAADDVQPDPLQLIDAARDGDLVMMETLLARGIDINATNSLGVTPLIAATASLQGPAVKLLLSRGARRSDRTNEGYTAYDFAKNQLNDELARLLADNGKRK